MEPSEARVIVCITCHNYEHYVEAAKVSVDTQTHLCTRAVFHDRCGTLYEPKGVAFTRNRIIHFLTPFDYLIFLDADDILPSNYVEEMLKASNGEKVIVASGTEYFGDEAGKIDVRQPINLETLLELNTINVSALIPVSVFRESSGFNEFDAYEDWEFWCRLAYSGYEFRHCPTTRLQRRIHAGSRHCKKTISLDEFRSQMLNCYQYVV